MSIKLAVFDIAGTTVADESAVVTAFRNAFEAYDLSVTDEQIKPLMGYRKTAAIQTVLEKLGVDWDEDLVEEIHDEFESGMIDYYEYSPDVKALPGAEDTFLLLKEKGIRIALNTGFSREIADTILHRMQWQEKGLVDDYIASDEVAEGRPQPFMIEKLMERAGVSDAGEVVKVGDTEVDVNEGRNAGCAMVVAVTTGAFSREQLEPYAPDHILDDLSQLPALIFDRA